MRALVEFWVEEHLPTVRRGAEEFLADHDHPSHAILQNWSLRRYERIERVLRECNFDFQRFPARYWPEVKRDLVAARAHKTGCHYAG